MRRFLLVLLLLNPTVSSFVPFSHHWLRFEDVIPLTSIIPGVSEKVDCAAVCHDWAVNCSGFAILSSYCLIFVNQEPVGPLEVLSTGIMSSWIRPMEMEKLCPNPDFHLHFAGSRYRLVTQLRNWTAAEKHCQSSGGHLTALRSQLELEKAAEWAGSVEGGSVWVGAVYATHGWRWGESANKSDASWLWKTAPSPGFTRAVLNGSGLTTVEASDKFPALCECHTMRLFDSAEEATATSP